MGTFRDNLKIGIAELLHSKKFIVGASSSLAVIIVRLAPKLGLGDVIDAQLANDLAIGILTIASVLIFGQGLSDFGKEAAVVKQQTDIIHGPPPADVVVVTPPPPAPPKDSP